MIHIIGLLNILGCLYILWKTWRHRPAAFFLAMTGGGCYVLVELAWVVGWATGSVVIPEVVGIIWSFQNLIWIVTVIAFLRFQSAGHSSRTNYKAVA